MLGYQTVPLLAQSDQLLMKKIKQHHTLMSGAAITRYEQ